MEEIAKATPHQEDIDDLLCKKCRNHYIDKSESDYSVLCSVCRENQIRYPFPKRIIIFFVLVLIACIISVIQFVGILDEYKAVTLADRAYNEKHYYTANQLYNSVYKETGGTDGIGAKLFETAIIMYNYEQATDMFNKHLYNKEVSDSEYQRLDPLVKKLLKYDEDQSYIAKLGIARETPIEKVISIFKSVPNEKRNLFIKYVLATNTKDFAASLDLLQEIYDDKEGNYLDVLSQIASCYRHLGDYDKAIQYAQEALNYNKENYEAIRQIAIVKILMKDYQTAVKEAEKAFEICPEGTYIADTLALAYYLNNDTENLSKIVEYSTKNNLLIDSYKEVSHKIKTVEDIYIGGM